VFLLPEAQHFR